MSHFSRLSVRISNRRMLERIAKQMGWEVSFVEKYKNEYTYSKEFVENVTVLKHGGKTKLVIAQDGAPITDKFYMGSEYESFLQKYARGVLVEAASMEGAMVSETVDKQGNIVLTLEYTA